MTTFVQYQSEYNPKIHERLIYQSTIFQHLLNLRIESYVSWKRKFMPKNVGQNEENPTTLCPAILLDEVVDSPWNVVDYRRVLDLCEIPWEMSVKRTKGVEWDRGRKSVTRIITSDSIDPIVSNRLQKRDSRDIIHTPTHTHTHTHTDPRVWVHT